MTLVSIRTFGPHSNVRMIHLSSVKILKKIQYFFLGILDLQEWWLPTKNYGDIHLNYKILTKLITDHRPDLTHKYWHF